MCCFNGVLPFHCNIILIQIQFFYGPDAEDCLLGRTKHHSSTVVDQDRHCVSRGEPFSNLFSKQPGFLFLNLSPLQPEQLHAFGLLATKGATKAFQLVVQAYVLKHLMFEGKMAKKAAK